MKTITLLFLLLTSKAVSAAPSCLAPNIAFWKKVFSEISEEQAVLHNPETFEIYAIMDKDKVDEYLESLSGEAREVTRVQSGAKEKWVAGLKRSKSHMKMIQNVLKKHGIPKHIGYLPHVESSFQPSAGSKVGAQGLWQIMPGTARMFGVRDRSKLKDPKISTELAAKILKEHYNELKSWDLALNAYHSGPGHMRRAVEQLGTRDVCKILAEYQGKTFKFASRNYLGQFYAVLELLDEKTDRH